MMILSSLQDDDTTNLKLMKLKKYLDATLESFL